MLRKAISFLMWNGNIITAQIANEFVEAGLITQEERDAITGQKIGFPLPQE